jgi:DNA-directed RNA polymerase subunit RPC12/RpoP
MAFELLQAEAPPTGFGVGVLLVVRRWSPPGRVASICRLVRAQGRQLVMWDRSLKELDPTGKPRMEAGTAPCTEKVARLRLKRTKTILHYLWAPGTRGDNFEEFHQCEFGNEDIESIVIAGTTGRKPCDLDLRITELRIRGTQAAMLTLVPQKGAWKVLLALGLGGAIPVGTWLAWRQSRRPRKRPSESSVPAQPANPDRAVAALSFVCPDCGKSLKAKRELAGKKVKCPQCSHAVLVPE